MPKPNFEGVLLFKISKKHTIGAAHEKYLDSVAVSQGH